MTASVTQQASFAGRGQRFHVLDGVRGFAALIVVLFHYLNPVKYSFVTNSYVAVDLFFILSGFVIYHSYASKLRSGMRARVYISHRFVRLMPTVAAGVLLGAIAVLCARHSMGLSVDPALFTLVHVGHAFFIPDFIDYTIPATGIPELFPSNGPLWSIFFEFFASVCFIWLVRLPKWGIIAGSIAMFGLLVLGCMHASSSTDQALTAHVGWSVATLHLGFARVLCAFLAGMSIYVLTQRAAGPSVPFLPVFRGVIPAFVIYAATLAVLLFPLSLSGAYPFIAIGVLCPLLIACGSRVEPGSRWLLTVSDWLGKLSFPLYCVHVPVRILVQTYLGDMPWKLQTILSILLAVLVSILLYKLLDWLRASQRISKMLEPITG